VFLLVGKEKFVGPARIPLDTLQLAVRGPFEGAPLQGLFVTLPLRRLSVGNLLIRHRFPSSGPSFARDTRKPRGGARHRRGCWRSWAGKRAHPRCDRRIAAVLWHRKLSVHSGGFRPGPSLSRCSSIELKASSVRFCASLGANLERWPDRPYSITHRVGNCFDRGPGLLYSHRPLFKAFVESASFRAA